MDMQKISELPTAVFEIRFKEALTGAQIGVLVREIARARSFTTWGYYVDGRVLSPGRSAARVFDRVATRIRVIPSMETWAPNTWPGFFEKKTYLQILVVSEVTGTYNEEAATQIIEYVEAFSGELEKALGANVLRTPEGSDHRSLPSRAGGG